MNREAASCARRAVVAGGTLLTWAVVTAGLGWATCGAWSSICRPGPAALDDAFTVVAAAGAELALTWLTAGVVLVALAAGRGRLGVQAARWAAAISPYAVRRASAAALGLTLVAGPASACTLSATGPAPTARVTAFASLVVAPGHEWGAPDPLSLLDRPARVAGWGGSTLAERLETSTDRAEGKGVPVDPETAAHATGGRTGSWVPERPVVAESSAGDDRGSAAREQLVVGVTRPDRVAGDAVRAAAERVVHRGDTLWSIAAADLAARLGRPATDAETARQWPRWYAANRDSIGADPGRLLPGQVLHAPDPAGRGGVPQLTLD